MSSGHALREAARKNNVQLAQQLLSQHITPNVRDKDGYTALHWAALNGSVSLTRLLLSNGANLYLLDNKNRTPLQIAVEKNFWEVVSIYPSLVKTDKADKARYRLALEQAIRVGKYSIVKQFLEANTPLPETTPNNDGLLHLSVRKNFAGIARILGRNGINLEIKNSAKLTALQLANALKKANCESSIRDLNKEGEALFNASAANNLELVRELLQKGVSPWIQIKESCALLQTSNLQIIHMLIAEGSDSFFKQRMILRLYYRALNEKNWTHGYLAAQYLGDKYLLSTELLEIMSYSNDYINVTAFLRMCENKWAISFPSLKINSITILLVQHIPNDNIVPILLTSLKNHLKQKNVPLLTEVCMEIGMFLFAKAHEHVYPDKVFSLAIVFFAHSPHCRDAQTCKIHCYLHLAGIKTVECVSLALANFMLSKNPEAKEHLLRKTGLYLKKYLEHLFPVSAQAHAEATFLNSLLEPYLKPNPASFFQNWSTEKKLPCLPSPKYSEKKSLAKN